MTSFIKRFYKDPDGRWFIDLPEYIQAGLGDKSNLEMVAGADRLLDMVSKNTNEVTIRFSSEPFENYNYKLERSSDYGYDTELDPEDDPGGWYTVKSLKMNLWLCPVTLYLFDGIYPSNIFISI